MKTLMLLFIMSFVSSVSFAENSAGFAVVELFTSEGCSSCPPADEIIADLKAKADKNNLPIYILGFHVDYWNNLGWTDRFSKPEYSERQRQYARYLGGQVYTPQAIVNGQSGFVGSEKGTLDKTVDRFLNSPAALLKLDIRKDNGKYILMFHLTHMEPDDVLQVAIVEDYAESQVTQGENAGQLLKHVNAVRSFQTISAQQSGEFSLPVFSVDWDVNHLHVIAFVQNVADFKIKSAGQIRLNDLPAEKLR